MKLLVDTNVFLEVLLAQDKKDEARALLESAGRHDLFFSEYGLHSIGLILFRRQHDVFRQFVAEVIAGGSVAILSLTASDLAAVTSTASAFNLDFDDAYHYAIAEKFGLTIVSFDRDFDRTPRGRRAPDQIN